MVRIIQDVVLLLNRLILVDYDAIDACKAAIAHIADPLDRDQLNHALEDHRGHADQLAVVVRNLGGEPACPGDLRPSRRRLAPAAVIDERSLLETLRRNEESNRAAYEAAASQPGVPLDVLANLERNLADECRHLAWVSGRLDGPSPGSRGPACAPAGK